jgi:hypothetical protein
MLGPTIYIPSGLAKLLIPLTSCPLDCFGRGACPLA